MTTLFNVITGFGSITVGIIDANIFLIPLLTLFNFVGTYIKPEIYMRTRRKISKGKITEVLGSFISVYIFGLLLESVYYGVGRIIGWLVSLI
jgi:hypothetical protein